ncbi:MAG: hypothetical protein B6D68_02945 [spirochete symbiont of Stewartia floridana]|nr:MAG: hypothetical protein B6D68_02945 [spirochete symbiont of Stewartia floridana]
MILGHGHPEVLLAVHKAVDDGLSYGCNHEGEAELAELVLEMIPYAESLRLVNSGTEAVMTALRLARGATGRSGIVKFDGCYHGHADQLLAGAGSGLLSAGRSASEGVPQSMVKEVHVLPYNDRESVTKLFEAIGSQIAAVIVEPVAGNMGLIPPAAGFLEALRTLTREAGALLIFDEVITGFRFGPGCCGEFVRVTPDLSTLGKILGGGMPIGGVVGRQDIMALLAPTGGVYQAGTLSGNPAATAAGIATLKILHQRGGESIYPQINSMAARIAQAVESAACRHGVDISAAQLGGAFTPFFLSSPPRNLQEAKAADGNMYAKFFHGMLRRGIYLPPSPFETAFFSSAHGEEEIHIMTNAIAEVCKEMET